MLPIIKKLFELEHWRIGLVQQDIGTTLTSGIESNSIEWLQLSKHDFNADPFVFKMQDNTFIAYEIFNYQQGKGKLKCVDLTGREYGFLDDINATGGHKSFPAIFQYQGEWYVLPETSDRNVLSLYKWDSKLAKFCYLQDLLTDGDYVDSCVQVIDDKCYIFTSTASEPFKQQLFIADDLFSTFRPHPASPIANDERWGRNAGAIIAHEGALYRVAQNCQGAYGKQLSIMKIDHISAQQYQESLFNQLLPSAPYPDGMHTLNHYDGVTVIDAKVFTYHWHNFFRKLFYKFLERFSLERQY